MWGAALFFITIVMVTPDGRAVVCDYVQQTICLFVAQLPYSDVALALMAISAVASLLMLRPRRMERRVERWIWREIRTR